MRIYDLIAKKRDGGTHTREELEAIVNGFVSGEVADYQMAAWMMARRVWSPWRRRPAVAGASPAGGGGSSTPAPASSSM